MKIPTLFLLLSSFVFSASGQQAQDISFANDIKATGVKPFLVLKESDAKRVIKTSFIAQKADY